MSLKLGKDQVAIPLHRPGEFDIVISEGHTITGLIVSVLITTVSKTGVQEPTPTFHINELVPLPSPLTVVVDEFTLAIIPEPASNDH